MVMSMGQRFRQAMLAEQPLQVAGTVNAYTAIMAKKAGFLSLYLSGAGVSNISYGVPDIGIINLDNILVDVHRIRAAVDLPLIVDIDTGFGNEHSIDRAIKALCQAGVAGAHIEDQVFDKRCGHLEGKKLVSIDEMCLRIKAAVAAKTDKNFCIIARTDAFSLHGIKETVKRAKAYKEAGADIIFPESLTALDQYTQIKKAIEIPILANITEFGKTPLFTTAELKKAKVDIALYPLSASRAMNQAAMQMYEEIRTKGTQKGLLDKMQTRVELYNHLGYEGL